MKIKAAIKNFLKLIRHLLLVLERRITKPEYLKLNIMSEEETIDMINKGFSISRFGDGEFQWMLGKNSNSFQKDSEELTKRLKEVYNSSLKNHLVCISNAFTTLNKFSYDDYLYWQLFLKKNWNNYKILFDMNKKYGNANISRPYMLYNNKERKKAFERFNNLKKIWNNKKLLIIEGEKTKIGVGNDLIKNAKEVKRILCPATNAFESYDEIISVIKNLKYKPDITIIALGPTASILAYDMCKIGMQAIDIGHIDIEYEWFLRKAKKRVPIPGKYVNECYDKNSIDVNIDDVNYKKSILDVIK